MSIIPQKSLKKSIAFLYINSERVKTITKNMTPFKIAPKKMKYKKI
jgi:hypothetical protein